MVTIAFILALLMIELIIPYFNAFTNQEISYGFLNSPMLSLGFVVTLLFVGLAAGSYPALLLSGYEPSRILKGQNVNNESGSSSLFRKGMVTIQFAISIFLIAATAVVYNQLEFAQNKDLGFDKEQVVVLNVSGNQARQEIEGLKQELSMLSGVAKVSASSDVPPATLNSWRILPEGMPTDEMELMNVIAVDEDFLEAMEMKLIEGRNFSADLASDREEAIILNETAVKWLGLESPIGTRFNLMNNLKQGTVIGVVEDFHLKSIHDEVAPVFLHLWPSWYDHLVVKLESADIKQTMVNIEDVWNNRVSGTTFDYVFLDESFEALYRQEERMAKVMTAGSSLAIFIACLGLLGLLSYTVERKTREIGIRKVLGASVSNILGLLSGEFLKLFIIGFVLAAPATWYIMNRWLQDFAYRIEIGPGIFLMAGGAAFAIAILTVGWQSIRATTLNPIESLRNE